MYIAICKIDDQCKFMHEAGQSELASGTTQRDGVWREMGGVQDGQTHVHM